MASGAPTVGDLPTPLAPILSKSIMQMYSPNNLKGHNYRMIQFLEVQIVLLPFSFPKYCFC